jgi:hypothetical protein
MLLRLLPVENLAFFARVDEKGRNLKVRFLKFFVGVTQRLQKASFTDLWKFAPQ